MAITNQPTFPPMSTNGMVEDDGRLKEEGMRANLVKMERVLLMSHPPWFRISFETMSPEASRENDERKIVVDEQSGTINGFPKVSLSADHFLLNKFAESNDANYMLVRDQVTKFVEEAKSCVAKRMRGKCSHEVLHICPSNDSHRPSYPIRWVPSS